MGDYSAICAVTGLPITSSQKVVGFDLEPYRYDDSDLPRNKWIPASWPVMGEYDHGGGIKDENLHRNLHRPCALVHQAVWNNAHIYWHKENRPYSPGWLDVPRAIEKARKEDRTYKKNLSGADYLFDVIKEQFNKTDFGLVFREMIDSKNPVTPDPGKYCFLDRSPFMEIILQKMLNGWTDSDQRVLDKLVCLYSGQMITGRFIGPCLEPHVEQYPRYGQRIETLEFSLALARKLERVFAD